MDKRNTYGQSSNDNCDNPMFKDWLEKKVLIEFKGRNNYNFGGKGGNGGFVIGTLKKVLGGYLRIIGEYKKSSEECFSGKTDKNILIPEKNIIYIEEFTGQAFWSH